LSNKKFQKDAYFLPMIFYMDTDADSFWKRANTLIKSQKTKQEAVAGQCGINYQTLRGWVTNHRFPDGEETYRIAQALNTSVEYLVTGEEPGKPDTEPLIAHAQALLDGLKKL
jgi:transcriptional regulator with XRE-family HTH domain